jgi:hypothetical protein
MKTKLPPKKANADKKRKNSKNGQKEPFSPFETPAPPQEMDPSQRRSDDKKQEKVKK